MEKRDMLWWWFKYLDWCKKNNWDYTKETYQEYKNNMKKLRAEIEKNDMLS